MSPKRFAPLLGAATLMLLLGACVSDEDHGHRLHASVDYDGYYDDFYGPITDGYWGADGVFMFTTDQGRSYHRDEARHIQRDATAGHHNIHGHHEDGHTDKSDR